METLRIQIPKEILLKVDLLIQTGLYHSRSELIRHALQEFILNSNFPGPAPFIVGPFLRHDFKAIFDQPVEVFTPPKDEQIAVQEKYKTTQVPKF